MSACAVAAYERPTVTPIAGPQPCCSWCGSGAVPKGAALCGRCAPLAHQSRELLSLGLAGHAAERDRARRADSPYREDAPPYELHVDWGTYERERARLFAEVAALPTPEG